MKVNNDNLDYVYKFDEASNNKAKSNNKNDLDRNAFLKLLTVQLSNQDPLNPIEDREFVAQLAQFSALEQMQNLNVTLNTKSDELLGFLDDLNSNQIDANIEILKELMNLEKAIEAYDVEYDFKQENAEEDVNTENVSGNWFWSWLNERN